MYPLLLHAHSVLRWLVLITLLIAIFNSIGKTSGQRPFLKKDRQLSLMALIFTHVQFLVGVLLYFISPKVIFSSDAMRAPVSRFYLVEHVTVMILAIILITIGYSRSKRAINEGKKFRNILVFYLLGLILILIGIPWPFRLPTAGWL